MLRARLEDAVRLSHKGARYLGFLDPAESAFLADLLGRNPQAQFRFWGGFADAQRQMLAVHPDWEEPRFPMDTLTLRFRQQDSLSHGDFLGALMGQGVTRAAVGDILLEPGRAVVFVKTELTPYFLEKVEKVGRVGVKCCQGAQEPYPQAYSFLERTGVIASARLDCFLAFLLGISREKAVQAIGAGLVRVNYQEAACPSGKIAVGDTIAVRHTGKFIVDRLGPVTKKGRLSVGCRKYV